MTANPNPVGDTARSKPASEIRSSRKGVTAPDDAFRCPVRRRGVDNPRFEERQCEHRQGWSE
jgi:hypothetical protein